MEAAGGGAEFDDRALGVFGVWRGAIPDARAAVNAFLAVENRDAARAGRDGLTGTDLDANLRAATSRKDSGRETRCGRRNRRGLNFAAHQQRVLMRDEEFAVERDRGPADPVHERVVGANAFGSAFLANLLDLG